MRAAVRHRWWASPGRRGESDFWISIIIRSPNRPADRAIDRSMGQRLVCSVASAVLTFDRLNPPPPTPNPIHAYSASDGPFFGGMRLVGSRYPVEVPLKLFFDPNPDEGNAGQEEKKESGVEPLPRPPLGDTVVVTAGWSNMSTHGFLSKACILDPRTNQPRRGLEIRGPPVQVRFCNQ